MRSSDRRDAVSASGQAGARVRNRRVDRTRGALLTAFVELLLERGYARVSVREIIARADVGRSTFYEHYQNKEELLADTLAPVLDPLAELVASPRQPERVRGVVQHIWASRDRTGAMLLGSSRALVTRILAERILIRLRRRPSRGDLRLFASALAAAQIAVLEAWITDEVAASVDEIAGTLRTVTAAIGSAVQSAD